MKTLKDEIFYATYGEHIVSIWMKTQEGDIYIKPKEKGRWLVDEVITYDIVCPKHTYHYRYNSKIKLNLI